MELVVLIILAPVTVVCVCCVIMYYRRRTNSTHQQTQRLPSDTSPPVSVSMDNYSRGEGEGEVAGGREGGRDQGRECCTELTQHINIPIGCILIPPLCKYGQLWQGGEEEKWREGEKDRGNHVLSMVEGRGVGWKEGGNCVLQKNN